MNPVNRLRGMADLSQEAWIKKQDIQNRLLELGGSHGYRCLETPILEPTELFLRKSGGQLASQLYSFTDSGSNPVSLRPEFTSPIMRYYLEHSAEVSLPVRWQYAGPVFRYEDDGGASGQFTQIGAELLGSSSIMADAELFGLAALVPAHLGLDGYTLELADLDLMNSVLDTVKISDRARSFIVGSIPQLRVGPGGVGSAIESALQQAGRIRLTSGGGQDDYLSQSIQGLDDIQAKKVLQGLLDWNTPDQSGIASDQVGQRGPEEVVDRMLRKVRGSDTEINLRKALEMASRMASIRGNPAAAMESSRSVVKESGANPAALERLERFVELVLRDPAVEGRLIIDLGLLRGLAYYNGIVFEVRHENQPTALGGGGRYDGLAGALGSPVAVPALGFAYNLETLVALTEATNGNMEPQSDRVNTLVTGNDSSSDMNALQAAQELRRSGQRVELDVCGLSLDEALAYARSKGIQQVMVAGRDGARTEHQIAGGKTA
ncbi:MAG: hypothetical protein BZY80_05220 [SAR202 cluster bacterium Io17-Chloro-G2]|nr:MAG: hypothetical protein BZY80_05220 [SAR202 cluster bacterium Io17-Chloro-G2]